MSTRRPNMPRVNRDAQRAAERRAAEERAAEARAAEREAAEERARRESAKKKPASAARGGAKVVKLPKSQARLRERAALSDGIRSGGPRSGGEPPTARDNVDPVPMRSFSGRLIALAVVLAAVTIMLLPTVGVYMDQREELQELRANIAQLEEEQDGLETLIARWEDPAYIRQQARERINLVMPGERKYMVVGEPAPEESPLPENASPSEVRTDLPWVDALWDSVKRAATD
ncbi:FtsB family cell division protein [Zhihengliuella halotolerans]|uniref:Cell division protein FtsB n=1 Tax=Zhihengliuella halotolerans TaxID=370736 RepID=A0A4Q8AEA1_9MICC|nr:septum formation initiator family protein [Zhihengliuella halotolerans]RZU62121.1 cell division protein FtsB [Zhihengliuella halotolerans]